MGYDEDVANRNLKFNESSTAFGVVGEMQNNLRIVNTNIHRAIFSYKGKAADNIEMIKYSALDNNSISEEALKEHKENGNIPLALSNIRVMRYTNSELENNITAKLTELDKAQKKLYKEIDAQHSDASIADIAFSNVALAKANKIVEGQITSMNALLDDFDVTKKFIATIEESLSDGKIPPPPSADSATEAKKLMAARVALLADDKKVVTDIIDAHETRITDEVNAYISDKKTAIDTYLDSGSITSENAALIKEQLTSLGQHQVKYILASKGAMDNGLAAWQKSLDSTQMRMDLTSNTALANKSLGELTQVEASLGQFTNTFPNVEELIEASFQTMDVSIQRGNPVDSAAFDALLNKYIISPQTVHPAAGVVNAQAGVVNAQAGVVNAQAGVVNPQAGVVNAQAGAAPIVSAGTVAATSIATPIAISDDDKLKDQKESANGTLGSIGEHLTRIDKNNRRIQNMAGKVDKFVSNIDKLIEKIELDNSGKLSKADKKTQVDRLNTLKGSILSRGNSMQSKLDEIKGITTEADALKVKAEKLKTTLESLNSDSQKAQADDIVADLKKIKEKLNNKTTGVTYNTQRLFDSINDLHMQNIDALKANPNYNTEYGSPSTINNAITRGFGKNSLLEPFRQTASGSSVGSVAGSYFDIGKTWLGDIWDGWEDMKQNSTSDKERFWYNLMETGGIIGLGIMALNKLEDWGLVSHGVKLVMLAAFIGWALHNSGSIGSEMKGWDNARNDLNLQGKSPYSTSTPAVQGNATQSAALQASNSGGNNIPSGAANNIPITNASTAQLSNFNFAFQNGKMVTVNHGGTIIPNAANNSTIAKAGSISANGSFIPKDMLGSNTIDLTKNSNSTELEAFQRMLGNLDPANNPNLVMTGTTGGI